MNSTLAKTFDASAVGLSALCLVHCLALPAMALLLPVLGVWARAEWVHVAFVLMATPIAALTFFDFAAGRPRSWPLAIIAALGLGLMVAGALEVPGPTFERGLTVLGGALLASAHIANWRRRHREETCGSCL